jgi:hypothetical protein
MVMYLEKFLQIYQRFKESSDWVRGPGTAKGIWRSETVVGKSTSASVLQPRTAHHCITGFVILRSGAEVILSSPLKATYSAYPFASSHGNQKAVHTKLKGRWRDTTKKCTISNSQYAGFQLRIQGLKMLLAPFHYPVVFVPGMELH